MYGATAGPLTSGTAPAAGATGGPFLVPPPHPSPPGKPHLLIACDGVNTPPRVTSRPASLSTVGGTRPSLPPPLLARRLHEAAVTALPCSGPRLPNDHGRWREEMCRPVSSARARRAPTSRRWRHLHAPVPILFPLLGRAAAAVAARLLGCSHGGGAEVGGGAVACEGVASCLAAPGPWPASRPPSSPFVGPPSCHARQLPGGGGPPPVGGRNGGRAGGWAGG